MSHLVITIGCEYGAKGNQIGRKIAEDLGFQFYDRNIVDAIIHEVGIPGEIMEKVEEGVTIVGKGAEGEERGEFSQYADLTKRAIHVQKTIIRKLSDQKLWNTKRTRKTFLLSLHLTKSYIFQIDLSFILHAGLFQAVSGSLRCRQKYRWSVLLHDFFLIFLQRFS